MCLVVCTTILRLHGSYVLYYVETFFFLRSGEVLLLINSTQAEASTGAFIEKYSHVVPHMVGMIKGYAYNPRVQTLDRRLVMIQTPARGGSY